MRNSPHITKELFDIFCSELIGEGMSRHVYSSEVLKDSVIKCESRAGFFQNVIEWETWKTVEFTQEAKWFAPCEWISPCGSVLIMKKTKPMLDLPETMPFYFTDFKVQNFGVLNNSIVCHDYGTTLVMTRGISSRKKKVYWSGTT